MATPKILIIYTGGTIGMGKDPVTGVLEPLDFNHLVSSMPEFQLIQAEIDVRKFEPPIDSSDMDPMRWAEIVSIISNSYNDYDGFVILHGTDTMAYTSSALSFMLENLTKPVILTGSQLPIGELRTDGKENLMTAIEIASAKDENGHPMVPEVFSLFPGIQDNIVRHVMESPDLRGIVMRTFGSGNAPHAPWIMRLLDEAAHRGVNIVNISQCLTGSVEMERYGAGFQLKSAHVISGHDSTVEAMVTKLMYLQGRYEDNLKVREMLQKSLAGEITLL